MDLSVVYWKGKNVIWGEPMNLTDIPGYERFDKIESLNKGFSSDKKFYIETHSGDKLLLRVSSIETFDMKKSEFENMKRITDLGIPMSQPQGFGICDDGQSVYTLLSWIDGKDAGQILPLLSETEQYILGLQAGEILRKIHSISAPRDVEDWALRFERKVNSWVVEYSAKTEVHSPNGTIILIHLNEHKYVLDALPQTLIHGDINYENIIVMPDGRIGVIDFSSFNTNYGDPWWDFNSNIWMPNHYPHFYTGQITGYFSRCIPDVFWEVLNYYMAYDALAALTDPYEINGINDGGEIINNILNWTHNFTCIVPTWYTKDWETYE